MFAISDGLTPLRIQRESGIADIRFDLVSWVVWYTERAEEFADDPLGSLALVVEKFRQEHGVLLNDTQADEFLVFVLTRYQEIKKKQVTERTLQQPME